MGFRTIHTVLLHEVDILQDNNRMRTVTDNNSIQSVLYRSSCGPMYIVHPSVHKMKKCSRSIHMGQSRVSLNIIITKFV